MSHYDVEPLINLKEELDGYVHKLSIMKNKSLEFHTSWKLRQYELNEHFNRKKDKLKLHIVRLNRQYFTIKTNEVKDRYSGTRTILDELTTVKLQTEECMIFHEQNKSELLKMIEDAVKDQISPNIGNFSKIQNHSRSLCKSKKIQDNKKKDPRNAISSITEITNRNEISNCTNNGATNYVANKTKNANDVCQETKSKKANAKLTSTKSYDDAFIFSVVKSNQDFTCFSCGIELQAHNGYLNHREEGLWKSYHVSLSCLSSRGFNIEYLNRTPVILKAFMKNIYSNLKQAGFLVIRDETIDNDAVRISNKKQQQKIHVPIATETEIVENTKDSREDVFIFSILKSNQNFRCFGCDLELTVSSNYLNHKEEYSVIPGKLVWKSYHLASECLSRRGFNRDYLGKTPVILKVVDNSASSKLSSLGFKEIRNESIMKDKSKSKNVNNQKQITNKKNPVKNTLDIQKPVNTPKNNVQVNVNAYVLNHEPFEMVFAVLKGVKCMGCNSIITANDSNNVNANIMLSLCHKEVRPRDKRMEEYFRSNNIDPPATSSYYHAKLECLHNRGFTNAYLNQSRCLLTNSISRDKVLTKNDKKTIRKLLLECNFSIPNINFEPHDCAIIGSGSDNLQPGSIDQAKKKAKKVIKPPVCVGATNFNNKYFRICKFKSIRHLRSNVCDGCQDNIVGNSYCITYCNSKGDGNDLCITVFHLNPNCIKRVFSDPVHFLNIPYRIDGDVNVNPNLLIQCGLYRGMLLSSYSQLNATLN